MDPIRQDGICQHSKVMEIDSQTSSPLLRKESIDQSDSFLADHSSCCSAASRANSKSPPLLDAAIFLTLLMLSFTPSLVPENLKKRVGDSFHTRGFVAPPRLITLIWTSSMISMAATGIPVCITPAAAAAASRMVGNVTTATEYCSGITASFKVAIVVSYSQTSVLWKHHRVSYLL